jgi:hypothetical protein
MRSSTRCRVLMFSQMRRTSTCATSRRHGAFVPKWKTSFRNLDDVAAWDRVCGRTVGWPRVQVQKSMPNRDRKRLGLIEYAGPSGYPRPFDICRLRFETCGLTGLTTMIMVCRLASRADSVESQQAAEDTTKCSQDRTNTMLRCRS